MLAEREKNTKFNQIVYYIITFFVIVNISVSAALYYFHVSAQKEGVLEEIINKSRAVGYTVATVIEKGLAVGIPLNELAGMDDYLERKTLLTTELEYIAITNFQGDLIGRSNAVHDNLRGSFKRFALSSNAEKKQIDPFDIFSFYNIPLRITNGSQTVGYIHIGLSNKSLESSLMDVFYNIAVILLTSIIIGYEFLRFIFKNSVQLPLADFIRGLQNLNQGNFSRLETPREGEMISALHKKMNKMLESLSFLINQIRGKLGHLRVPGPVKDLIEDDWANLQKKYVFAEKEVTYNNVVQSVESIRIIAFLAVFSEAILLTMLPNYAEQFYQAEWIISKQFVATLPIIFFTLFAAVSIFGSTYLNSRLGIRKSLLFGLAVYIFGHLLAFFMGTFLAFILTRCVTALGYGITFASCQNYVATYSESKDRVQSYAIFVVASGSGFLCGTPVGGILVDNIGQSYTFIVAFLIGLLSFYFAKINTLDAKADFSYESLNRGQIRHILKEKEFMSSLTLSGFPTRLMFTALIGYFYPLYLVSLGNSPSAVGRIMMLFGFFMFVVAPFAARAVSRFKIPHYAALFCSTFIALSLLMVWYYGNTISVMIGIVAYTVAAVIHISSMMSIIEHVSCNEDNKLSRSSVLMFYFVVERFSMIVGPALFGFILTASSFSKTLLWVSLGLILINGVYAYLLFGQSKPERGQK